MTESTEGEQEVMGMGATSKGALLSAAFEIVFLPRNKFKDEHHRRTSAFIRGLCVTIKPAGVNDTGRLLL
ncbi:hypothetical protein [Paenibacillus contaminans]|uniref:Uncharacterized protein n=1 Tax=Paenibacillus contaminans TaxID=450362 RepID=A0A329M9F9_9BACL|nr:hypothetical protein [Paenibacillus contaminans]RAV16362.1 hypothetical protein DQG23_28490 [Paenibacillus contaminans]